MMMAQAGVAGQVAPAMSSEVVIGNGMLGILREARLKWERRAPLTPSHCARLLRDGAVARIVVQPCTKRIHSDAQYADAGCEVSDDLSPCGTILGVKQPLVGSLLPGRSYMFFSHTVKAQPQNFPVLDEVLQKSIALYDYECIVDKNKRRLVAFGAFAGRAGMIDFLRGLGERLLALGYSTPFLAMGSAYMYPSLSAAKAAVVAVGEAIASQGLPPALSPLIFAFTGTGRVSSGAIELFKLLPHKMVSPEELPDIATRPNTYGENVLYGTIITAEHMVAPIDPSATFDKAEYYEFPERYRPVFHERVAPYISAVINCMYWEYRFPKLLANEQLKQLELRHTQAADEADAHQCPPARTRLFGVADITCDLEGSIECLKTQTTVEHPFFRYDPVAGSWHDDMDGPGIFVLGVDILPSELPLEATKYFGDALFPFIQELSRAKSPQNTSDSLRRSCIAFNGSLTPLYEYIERMRQEQVAQEKRGHPQSEDDEHPFATTVSLTGHLFDTFVINDALDIIEEAGGRFRLVDWNLGQTRLHSSTAALRVSAASKEALDGIIRRIAEVAGIVSPKLSPTISTEVAELHVSLDHKAPSRTHSDKLRDRKKVLVLGAGRVCAPLVRYLASINVHGKPVHVTVASLYLQDAKKVTDSLPSASATPLQLDSTNLAATESCIRQADVVVSLLPPECHVPVAELCIASQRHLVTASYVSQDMAALHDRAQSAGVTLLCELGLDPGIDHMAAMQMIDRVHSEGGRVESFISMCGGLPAPAAADNPLGYRFSWNPRGALAAGRNAASYKWNSQVVEVLGEGLFKSAVPISLPQLPAFALERIPNRDSLSYGQLYSIDAEASTVFRATLRYQGFSKIMNAVAWLGYFHTELQLSMLGQPRNYQQLFWALARKKQQVGQDQDLSAVASAMAAAGACGSVADAKGIIDNMRRLGFLEDTPLHTHEKTPMDAMCTLLESKLMYQPGQQDMVLLHHELQVVYPSRASEQHSATLLAFGDERDTAMARTVGLPAAIGTMLLLSGRIDQFGVVRPISAQVYEPVLEELKRLGVHMDERTEVH